MIQEAITNILERAFKFHLISKLKREEIFVQIKVTDVCALDPTKFSTFDGFHSLDVTKYFSNNSNISNISNFSSISLLTTNKL